MARTVWAGERTDPLIEDSRDSEWDATSVLLLGTVVLGVLPGPLLAMTSGSVAALLGGGP